MSERTKAQLVAERDFLLARLTRRYHGPSWVGISSNEMLLVAITGRRIDGFDVPHDMADLGRCEETYRRAPEHLKPALAPILAGFRILVAERYERPGSYTLEEATRWAEEAIARNQAEVEDRSPSTAGSSRSRSTAA